MDKEIVIEFIERNQQHSDYDWANITFGEDRVGKARCNINGDKLIIYSINIFPEFEGHGYGKAFVINAKTRFKTIIADKVRFTAIGFWDKMGFIDNHDGNWIFRQ